MQNDIKQLKTMVRSVINGQSSMKSELLTKIEKLDKKIDGVEETLTKEIKSVDKNLSNRINMLGKQLNTLDDDAPTGEEFKALKKRVDKLEHYSNFATV